MMPELLEQVCEYIAVEGLLRPGETLVLGVSGGADSLCLWHLLRRLSPDWRLTLHVAHLDHGLRAESADDARYVTGLAAAWGDACTVERVDAAALARERRQAIEEAARQARYAFLGRVARRVGASAVAVGHNADDQVETVLMHLLRGSGLAGLRGMRPLTRLDDLRLGGEEAPSPADGEGVRLLRPLLAVRRNEIEAYCRAEGLAPRFDLSNLDRTYYRNRLRHELLPYLESYNPRIRELLWRTARVAAGDYEVLRQRLDEAWGEVVREEDDEAVIYDLDGLRAQPLGLQRALLREGVQRLRRSLRDISWVHVEQAVRLVRAGRTGAVATLPRGLMLRLDYHTAIMASPGRDRRAPRGPRLDAVLALPEVGEVPLAGGAWRLSLCVVPREALPADWDERIDPRAAYFDAERLPGALWLRTRRPGDRLRPLGMGGRRQKVSDLMVNARVPIAERDRVPLLVAGEEILWVVGWRQSEVAALNQETRRVLVVRLERVDTQRRAGETP